MADDKKYLDIKAEQIFSELVDELKDKQNNIYEDNDLDDEFDEYLVNSVATGVAEPHTAAFSCGGCDSCRRKEIITEQYYRVSNREYMPPYVDRDTRDFRISLVINRLDEEVLQKAVAFLVFRTRIEDVTSRIVDVEWKKEAEQTLRHTGFRPYIESNFGKLTKAIILQMMFDVNYCPFDCSYSRTLDNYGRNEMIKFYIMSTLRDSIKDNIYKFAKIIELELEYQIAVIEGEIRYIIRCILEQIVISPLPFANYNIAYFNKIGSLTELLRIVNGVDNGKHDQRSDFRNVRDTIKKYQKVVETSFELLNKKIKQYECLINQRILIVGITGICEKVNIARAFPKGRPPVIVPPVPIVVLNPPVATTTTTTSTTKTRSDD